MLAGGETTMRRCRPGFAKSQAGQFRCVRCDPGSCASSTGFLHCRVCPYGTWSNTPRTGCGATIRARADSHNSVLQCNAAR